MNKEQDISAAQLHQATAQALGLMLQAIAQQTNATRLHQDMQARLQAARIVGINPLALQLLEQAASILKIDEATKGKN